MKRFLVIEVDSSYNSVWIHEVTREFTSDPDANKGVAYHRNPNSEAVMFGMLGPKFYGQLDALMITADKIEKAAPIEPELEAANVSKLGQ